MRGGREAASEAGLGQTQGRNNGVGKEWPSAGCIERLTRPDGEVCLDLDPLLSVTFKAEDCLWSFKLQSNKLTSTRDGTVGGTDFVPGAV